jgi:hypothetical protein
VYLQCKYGKEDNYIVMNKLFDRNVDYTRYIYRQKTLQLLSDLNDYSKKTSEMKIYLKNNIRDLFSEIKKYMVDNELRDDKFLKNLCDDIYIAYRTLGTKYGSMYTYARQTSQGTQRCYTMSQTPVFMESDDLDDTDTNDLELGLDQTINKLLPRQPRLLRNNYFDGSIDINDIFTRRSDLNDNEDILMHHMTDFDDMPYVTPTATMLMREVSGLNFTFDSLDEFVNTQEY